MTTYRTISNPIAHPRQPLATRMPAAGAGKTQFVRPPIDSAPPNGQGWDIIHPNASAEENELVSKAAGVSTFADFPNLGIRTNFIAQKEGSQRRGVKTS